MSRGLVLVIEDDEWLSRLLQGAIRDAGYEVVLCATARVGVETAIVNPPDCIVCDIDLPDNDGYWVARNVRTHPSRVSVTPFLFLSGLDDEASRLEGFHVGADVYMTKPFRTDEVVAQIGALVQMATRLRARRDSLLSVPPGAPTTALAGDIGQMSIATVLTVLEMERRSGTFEVVSKKRRAQLEIVGGAVVEGTVGGTHVTALAALRTMLGWNVGRFTFTPGPERDTPAGGGNRTLGAFLIEAMRLADETARAELDLPPSRHAPRDSTRLAAPSLGGPATTPADFAPPSSRTPRQVEIARLLDTELSDWEIPAEVAPADEGARISRPAILPPPEPAQPQMPAVHKAQPPPLPRPPRPAPPLEKKR
jgi:DNA-binding response OmpR family regulator